MGRHRYLKRSALFLLRLWAEEESDGEGEMVWRGKVQRVLDGESHHFKDWQELIDSLATMLSETGAAGERLKVDPESKE